MPARQRMPAPRLCLALGEKFTDRHIQAAHTAASEAPVWGLPDVMGGLPAMLPTVHQ